MITLSSFYVSSATEIHCIFRQTGGWFDDSVSNPSKSLFTADFTQIFLRDDSETVTINTNDNNSENNRVAAIWFQSTTVNFIPNVIFKTFPNAYYIWFGPSLNLPALKQKYFEGANNLSHLMLEENGITELPMKVFINAENLEYINLRRNKISVVHDEAFYGLKHLKGLYLRQNMITKLSDNTFKHLNKLSEFDLIDFYIYEKCLTQKARLFTPRFGETKENSII